MSRILFRRITTATALAALLTLAAPAQAAGWNGWAPDGDLLHSAWKWVASFWIPQAPSVKSDRGSGIDPNGQVQPDRSSGIDPNGVKSDRGSSIDPNGGTTSYNSCQTNCERGAEIDPNG